MRFGYLQVDVRRTCIFKFQKNRIQREKELHITQLNMYKLMFEKLKNYSKRVSNIPMKASYD